MEFQGNLGPSGKYDVKIDGKANVVMALEEDGPVGSPIEGGYAKMEVGVPLEKIFDAAAAATKNGTLIMVEGAAKQALELYISIQGQAGGTAKA